MNSQQEEFKIDRKCQDPEKQESKALVTEEDCMKLKSMMETTQKQYKESLSQLRAYIDKDSKIRYMKRDIHKSFDVLRKVVNDMEKALVDQVAHEI
jgi:hypothetical protein